MTNKMTDHEITRRTIRWGFDKLVREGASSEDIWIYLHVSGLAIKVKRELPMRLIRMFPGVYHPFPQTGDKAKAQQEMLEAGWGVTIPLKEE